MATEVTIHFLYCFCWTPLASSIRRWDFYEQWKYFLTAASRTKGGTAASAGVAETSTSNHNVVRGRGCLRLGHVGRGGGNSGSDVQHGQGGKDKDDTEGLHFFGDYLCQFRKSGYSDVCAVISELEGSIVEP